MSSDTPEAVAEFERRRREDPTYGMAPQQLAEYQAAQAAQAAVESTPNVPALAEPVRTTPPALGMDYLPDADELDRLMRIADVVSRSAIVPANYRTTVGQQGNILQDKRPNVMVAALMGRTFGWDLLTAMRNIHVIEGAASLKPESMLGLIRARGHRVKIVRGQDRVTVHGRRADTGDEQVAEFSFADAYRANLAAPGDNGMPRARSKDGKPLPWEQYPLDMCQWRAVAQLCRGLFADVALGLAYTPEELGALVDAEGAVVLEAAPMPTEQPPAPQPAAEPVRPASAQPPADPDNRIYREPEQQPAEQPAPSLEDRLAKAKADQEARNAARHSAVPVNNAKARALDAVQHAYPRWTMDECLQEIRTQLQEIDPQLTTHTATADHFHTIGAKYELVELERIQGGHNA
jgi:hypothetical protein